ncbi:hypothetical protein FQN50_002282 [Emmonsiellopsis sp. PD_5]|nr:hypothetical protein FQN50_002282 [Emmonsiellopsis sp. PD_5]
MADIRALLRNELASRRATDSNSPSARPTKKRKLAPEEDDIRKKSRAAAQQQQLSPEDVRPEADQEVEEEAGPVEPPVAETPDIHDRFPSPEEPTVQAAPAQIEPQAVDEDEWAAFEREVAAPTKLPTTAPPAAIAAITSSTAISAAPVTAAELAERERMERESQMSAREQETVYEKEDAARLLEEEFDEMQQLEERVKRLKEMRDEIRRRKAGEMVVEGVEGEREGEGQVEVGGEGEEDVDEDEEDEEWDNWRFR